MKKLPRGALFARRTPFVEYGPYVTWKMLHAFAILAGPPSDDLPIWTAKAISEKIGMSRQRTLLALERMKKRGWVAWDRDALGRQAWVITQEGFVACHMELKKRVVFEVPKSRTLAEYLLVVWKKADFAKTELMKAGWTRNQAKEELIRYPLHKILWAVRAASYRVTNNLGAYMRALIEIGHQTERRCRRYLEATVMCAPVDTRRSIVKEAMKTTEPLRVTVSIAHRLWGYQGKDLEFINPRDVDEICYGLHKEGMLKRKSSD